MNVPPSADRPDWSMPRSLVVVLLLATIASLYMYFQVVRTVDQRPAGYVGGPPAPMPPAPPGAGAPSVPSAQGAPPMPPAAGAPQPPAGGDPSKPPGTAPPSR